MGAPTSPGGSAGATLPTGYPPPAQQYPSSQQYQPGPQYPPPQYPPQYETAQAQPQQQYVAQQSYVQQSASPKPVPAVGVPAGPAQTTYASTLQPQPTPGMATRGPLRPPGPGDVLLGYEICQPETGCCKCDGLSLAGVLSVILLLFFFFPLACIPCCMPECYEPFQRPVYGRQP